MSKTATISFYILVILIESFFAYLCQKKVKKINCDHIVGDIRPFWFVMAFMVHWVVISFTNIGSDYINYYDEIVYLNWSNFLNSLNVTEPGFTFLCVFLKTIFTKPDIVIFAFKTITSILEFIAIWQMRYEISLSLCLFTYNVLLFPRLFYILAMMLAISLLMNSVVLLLHGRNKLSFVLLIVGVLFHNSLLCIIPIYLYYYIYYKKGHSLRTFLLAALLLAIFGVLARYKDIYNIAMTRTDFFNQYSHYSLIPEIHGTGLLQYAFFMPVLYFVIKCCRFGIDKRLCGFTTVFALFGFVYALLGYRISVFARMQYNFTALYCILIPAIIYDERIRQYRVLRRYGPLSITTTSILWKIYILIRAIDVFVSAFGPHSVSEVSNYNFFWPF